MMNSKHPFLKTYFYHDALHLNIPRQRRLIKESQLKKPAICSEAKNNPPRHQSIMSGYFFSMLFKIKNNFINVYAQNF